MRFSLLEARSGPVACLFPGDELNSSAVDLLKTPVDLVPPGLFGTGIDRLIQTADQ